MFKSMFLLTIWKKNIAVENSIEREKIRIILIINSCEKNK